MRNRFLATLTTVAGLCTIGSFAAAQSQSDLILDFQNENPGAHPYFEEGEFMAVYGRAFSNGDTPEQSVQNFLNRYAGMIAGDLGDLRPIEGDTPDSIVRGVMFNRDTRAYKFSLVSFEQARSGIPVFRSRIGFLMRNDPGYPMVLSGWSVRDLGGFDPGQNGGEVEVTKAMVRAARRSMGVDEVQTSDPQRVIYAGVEKMHEEPRLAVVFTATWGSTETYPDYQKRLFVADANTGEILHTENQIHEMTDVVGNVSGRATDGWRSGNCDPQSTMGMPWAQVRIQGGNTAYADVNGDYVIPHGGGGQVTVESRLMSRWFTVRDIAAGGATPLLTQNVTPPGPANFLHNPSNTEFPRANVDCYLHSNIIRDFVLEYAPNFPVINTQQGFIVNTNISSSCNAYYDGAINFFRAQGGCSNTGNSTIVYHEYGHHLIAVTGNGQGQMGEGTGDTMAYIISDQPQLAMGFQNCNSPLRSGVNNIQYPCSGGHNCAGLLSGAVWETRNELVNTEPIDYYDIVGSLFVNMLIVRGQTGGQNGTQITPFITILFLELDDDDNDINNGTPHYFEIAQGFGEHNLDAPPIESTSLNDFDVVVGSHISGGLGDVATSNNVRLRTRSGFGANLAELHKLEMVVNASTIIGSPSTLDLTVESRNSDPGGQGAVSYRNWNTGQFVQVGSYAVNTSDNIRTIDGVPAADYVNGGGEIDILFKYTIFVPFVAYTFDTFFDWIELTVN